MITKLDWDSDFFNLRIGRADIVKKSDFLSFFDKESKNFDLIYVFSKKKIRLAYNFN